MRSPEGTQTSIRHRRQATRQKSDFGRPHSDLRLAGQPCATTGSGSFSPAQEGLSARCVCHAVLWFFSSFSVGSAGLWRDFCTASRPGARRKRTLTPSRQRPSHPGPRCQWAGVSFPSRLQQSSSVHKSVPKPKVEPPCGAQASCQRHASPLRSIARATRASLCIVATMAILRLSFFPRRIFS